MDIILQHCPTCTCINTNQDQLGQKIVDISDGECAYITFRLLVLEFMAKHNLTANKISKATGICTQTMSNIVKGKGKHLSFSTISRLFNFMKERGFMGADKEKTT